MTDPKTIEELKAELDAAYVAYDAAANSAAAVRALVALGAADAAYEDALEAQENSND